MEKKPKRGDIYIVDIPKTTKGSEQRGRRPGVIISCEKANAASTSVGITTGTSQIKRLDLPFHYLLPPMKGLPLRTMIEGECIYYVDKSRLLEYRCHLGKDEMKKVDRAVREGMREKQKRKYHGGNRKGVNGNKKRKHKVKKKSRMR